MSTLPLKVEKRVAQLKVEFPEIHTLIGPDLNGQDLYFIFRSLTMGEYMHFVDLEHRNQEAAVEYIYDTVLDSVWSSSKNRFVGSSDIPAGYAQELYELTKESSKFSNPEELAMGLGEYRATLNFVFPQAMAFIMKAFSQYKIEDVEGLTHEKLCKLISLAEYATGIPFDITPVDNRSKQKQESKILHSISKEQEMNDRLNDKYINFGAENAAIQGM